MVVGGVVIVVAVMVQNKLHSFSEKNCTMNYPFAYLNGDYCCKTNQELWYGGNASEVALGTCDGTGFSIESTCCNDHDYQKCPHPAGCYDFNQTTPGWKIP